MLKLEAQVWGDEIFLRRQSFEHLLACLSNQKMLPLSEDQSNWEKDYVQQPIDDFYNQGTELLNHNGVEPEMPEIDCDCECCKAVERDDYSGEWYG